MALVKRDKRIPPGWKIKMGPMRTTKGHLFSIKEGETTWSCHTCNQKFSFISLAEHHECASDKDPKPYVIKKETMNGVEINRGHETPIRKRLVIRRKS